VLRPASRRPAEQSAREPSPTPTALEIHLERAHSFIDTLAELPPSSWLEVGRSLLADRDGRATRDVAWSALERVIREHQLEVSAWNVRDAVETVAFLVTPSHARLSRAERRSSDAARQAAEDAAAAMLARPYLDVADFETLCAPFGECPGGAPAGGSSPAGLIALLTS